MSDSTRRVSAVVPYVLGAAAVVGLTIAFPHGLAWIFLHPPRFPHHTTPRAALGLDYERVRLRTSDDVLLSAWFVPVQKNVTPRGMIILCHGYQSNRAGMLPYLDFLHKAGYAVLMPDFRAHGWSGGKLASFGVSETLDLCAAIDWAESQPLLRDLPLALVGESMGASVSLLIAATDARVCAVVADSPYARFDKAVEGRLLTVFGSKVASLITPRTRRAGEHFLGVLSTEIAPVDVVRHIAPRPVFLIQGLADRFIVPQNARDIREAGGETISLWEVEGAGHTRSIHQNYEEYASRVVAFLDDALTTPAVTPHIENTNLGV